MEALWLILGLALTLAGANYLTDGSADVAKRLRIPEFIIGLTVVAVGTSAPELVVSVLSAIAGKSDVAIGNVVGSNIFNVFVILGICALIAPIVLTRSNIRRDIPIGLGASLLLPIFTSDRLLHDTIVRAEGVFMLICYITVMVYTVRSTPRDGAAQSASPTPTTRHRALWLSIAMIGGGLAALVAGGEIFLRSATEIARKLGVSESVIAITLVAGGTSLPELASSVVSILKGKAELALGNIVGSNIANILLILGLSATIHPLSMGGITHTDIWMTVLSALLLFLTAFTFRRRTIDRWEGAIFLAIYGGYIAWLLVR